MGGFENPFLTTTSFLRFEFFWLLHFLVLSFIYDFFTIFLEPPTENSSSKLFGFKNIFGHRNNFGLIFLDIKIFLTFNFFGHFFPTKYLFNQQFSTRNVYEARKCFGHKKPNTLTKNFCDRPLFWPRYFSYPKFPFSH